MPTSTVKIGALYIHDKYRTILRCEAASVPELDNRVFLIYPSQFAEQDIFIIDSWRGTWEDFKRQWSEVKAL